MLSRSERKRLAVLRAEGYLTSASPLTEPVLVAVAHAARNEPRPAWFDVFLSDVPLDRNEFLSETGHLTTEKAMQESHVIFEMLGRADDLHDGLNSPRVLANWLRYGLNVTARKIAELTDCSNSYASRVRDKWGSAITALLSDARVLGIAGEDLYYSAMVQCPQRLLARLGELRRSRNEHADDSPRTAVSDRMLKQAWLDYRAQMGLKGASPDKFSIEVPRWFVKEYCE